MIKWCRIISKYPLSPGKKGKGEDMPRLWRKKTRDKLKKKCDEEAITKSSESSLKIDLHPKGKASGEIKNNI